MGHTNVCTIRENMTWEVKGNKCSDDLEKDEMPSRSEKVVALEDLGACLGLGHIGLGVGKQGGSEKGGHGQTCSWSPNTSWWSKWQVPSCHWGGKRAISDCVGTAGKKPASNKIVKSWSGQIVGGQFGQLTQCWGQFGWTNKDNFLRGILQPAF